MGLYVRQLDRFTEGEKIMELVLSIAFGAWFIFCGVVYFLVTKYDSKGNDEK